MLQARTRSATPRPPGPRRSPRSQALPSPNCECQDHERQHRQDDENHVRHPRLRSLRFRSARFLSDYRVWNSPRPLHASFTRSGSKFTVFLRGPPAVFHAEDRVVQLSRSSDMNVGPAVPIGFGTADDFAGDGGDFSDTEEQEADQIRCGIAFGPFEVDVR